MAIPVGWYHFAGAEHTHCQLNIESVKFLSGSKIQLCVKIPKQRAKIPSNFMTNDCVIDERRSGVLAEIC